MNGTKSTARLGYLDALRGFAAMYVVVYHISLIPKPALEVPGWLKAFVGFGVISILAILVPLLHLTFRFIEEPFSLS